MRRRLLAVCEGDYAGPFAALERDAVAGLAAFMQHVPLESPVQLRHDHDIPAPVGVQIAEGLTHRKYRRRGWSWRGSSRSRNSRIERMIMPADPLAALLRLARGFSVLSLDAVIEYGDIVLLAFLLGNAQHVAYLMY